MRMRQVARTFRVQRETLYQGVRSCMVDNSVAYGRPRMLDLITGDRRLPAAGTYEQPFRFADIWRG